MEETLEKEDMVSQSRIVPLKKTYSVSGDPDVTSNLDVNSDVVGSGGGAKSGVEAGDRRGSGGGRRGGVEGE